MKHEGTLKLEYIKDGKVVSESSCQIPISDEGVNRIIDVTFREPVDTEFCKDSIKPMNTITLPSPDGRKAIINFGGDAVTYSGDLPVDEAAKLFFEEVFGYFQPGTCRTCIWYKADSSTQQCSCPKMLYGYSCKYDSIEPDDDGLAIENDEGWGMSPEPGFGCIHHKEKS